MRYRGQLIGFIAGTLYAIVCAQLFSAGESSSAEILEFVSLAMILGTPVAVGVVTVLFATNEQSVSKSFRFYGPWLSVLGWSALSLILAWETIVCVVMLLPVYLPLATIGGVLGGYARSNFCDKTNRGVVACSAVIPLFLGAVEVRIESPTYYHSVTSSIVIAAPIEKVWRSLPNIENIQPTELPWTLSHALGIPKPLAAKTEELRVGAVRDIFWQDGVHFQERITAVVENQRLAYTVLADEQSMRMAGLDTHVIVGGKYFEVEEGEYTLRSDGESTKLALTTAYRISSNLNWYGSFWANFVLDDFHRSVLTMIRDRNED